MISDAFKEFLISQEIDVDTYLQQLQVNLPRYICLHHTSLSLSQQQLETHFQCKVDAVPWRNGFYALESHVGLSTSTLFQQGKVYGLDVSSAVAVDALEIQPTDHVLDLCCAPGMKMLLIAEKLKQGTVTGVDYSKHRLANCKSLMRKYKLERARLFCADGTTFSVYAPSRIGMEMRGVSEDVLDVGDSVKETDSVKENIPVQSSHLINLSNELKNKENQQKTIQSTHKSNDHSPQQTEKVKPFHATKLLRSDPQHKHPHLLYDKVLVDAECTHDGSIAHVKKYTLKVNWQDFDRLVLNEERLGQLCHLQQCLLENGFKLVRKGGIVVYATCSFSKKQNEDVVAWFIRKHAKDAVLESIVSDSEDTSLESTLSNSSEFINSKIPLAPNFSKDYPDIPGMQHVVRLDPLFSKTSGLFVAKIRKLN